MAIPKRLLKHLDKRGVKYEVIAHKPVFTAFDLATTLGEELDRVMKTVVVRADRDLAFVSVPASARLDFAKVAKALGAKKVSLASEASVEKLKIIEGTTPPFASLYGERCVMDGALAKCRQVVCRAGSRTESLRCSMKDYVASEKPIVASVTEKKGKKKVVAKAKPAAKKRMRPTKKLASRGKR